MTRSLDQYHVAVVGGAGHVGAPLSITLAVAGIRTLVYDVNRAALDLMAKGRLGFTEEGGEELLAEAMSHGALGFATDPAGLEQVEYLIVTIGTPIDEFHNPDLNCVIRCIDQLLPHLRDGQTIILRSTVYPGVTDYLHKYLEQHGRRLLIAFCPERVVQGQAIRETRTLPQIISGTTPQAEAAAARLFTRIAPSLVFMRPAEAEFCKLVCNAYRYIQFAAANQFYMMAEAAGLDFFRILKGLKEDYPRMRDFPRPGLTAGPCLYKDTLQLVAFAPERFGLGPQAIQANEGVPAYILDQLSRRYRLNELRVGLLGMAFKAESDDRRSSLSYKLKKLLRVRAREVLTTDPHVHDDPELLPVEDVVSRSDLLILCTPHAVYADLDLMGKPVYDLWNFVATTQASPSGLREAA